MLVRIPQVLSGETLARCREIVAAGPWADGRLTAGSQSEQMKNNLQLPETSAAAREGGRMVLDALAKSALFFTAALPKCIFPPLFNCYTGSTNVFGDHIDNAIRTHTASGERLRTDIAGTLFLTAPDEYDGGELIIEESFSTQSVKLAAGDLVVYPASSVHRVEPVTRGARMAAFFWLESMVRSVEQRRLLYQLDMAVLELRQAHGDTAATVRLTGCYHNLLRMWVKSKDILNKSLPSKVSFAASVGDLGRHSEKASFFRRSDRRRVVAQRDAAWLLLEVFIPTILRSQPKQVC